MGRIKVLIFDKNKLFKDAIAYLLKDKEKIKSVFSLSQSEHIFTVFEKFNPDLVLINSIQVKKDELKFMVNKIKEINDDVNIFILNNDENIIGRDVDRFVDLIIPISKDQNYLYNMIKKYVNTNNPDRINDFSLNYRFHNLSDRELDVVNLISKGMSNQEIADELIISERTVKNHVSNILKKLSVNDRTQALIKCLKMGIVELN